MLFQHQLSGNDCYVTCICNVLDIKNTSAPKMFLYDMPTPRFWAELHDWVNSLGYILVLVKYSSEFIKQYPEDIVFIACGKSPYGDTEHAVLWRNDKLFFDPKPENKGIVGDPIDITFLVPMVKSGDEPMR